MFLCRSNRILVSMAMTLAWFGIEGRAVEPENGPPGSKMLLGSPGRRPKSRSSG